MVRHTRDDKMRRSAPLSIKMSAKTAAWLRRNPERRMSCLPDTPEEREAWLASVRRREAEEMRGLRRRAREPVDPLARIRLQEG